MDVQLHWINLKCLSKEYFENILTGNLMELGGVILAAEKKNKGLD